MSWSASMIERLCVVFILAALAGSPALAEEPHGCSGFKWPVQNQQAAMGPPDVTTIASGTQRNAAPAAFRLMLKATSLPQPPERRPKDPASLAGFVTIMAATAGTYQVTLDTAAWIDLIQNGAYLKPQAFSGALDCAGVRKLVRFQVESGPLTLQVSGASSDQIRLIVAPAPAD